jgi:hypothetical protein
VPVSAPAARAPAPVLAALTRVNTAAAQLLTGFLPSSAAQARNPWHLP